MKKLFSQILIIVFYILLTVSCSKGEDTPADNPVGGDAFRMQIVTIDLPNTSLPNSEYHGSMDNTEITLTKADEHKLLFMVPSTMGLGNQDLVINDLNNMKITYNVKDVVFPDTPDAVISDFQNNLSTFQATTSGNIDTQNAINSFNNVYENSSTEDKIKLSTLYYANKAMFDDVILNDYSNVSGRTLNGAMNLLWKHKAAVIAMTAGVYIVLYCPGLEKVAGAALVVAGAYKAKVFGENFGELVVNTTNLVLDGTFGENNKNMMNSSLQLQNDIVKTIPIKTADRKVINSDSSKENIGTKLYFTYKNIYNGFVEQVNPVLQWINTNIPFANFNMISSQILPATASTIINPIESSTYNNLTLSINSPNLSLESSSLMSAGQLGIRVKIIGTSASSVNGYINYSFNDDFSTFSGKIPITVSNDTNETVTIGTQIWMKKNLDVSTYRNGDPIPQVQDPSQWVNLTTGAWCYYENITANGTVYGKLYNWYAVNDPRGLAPVGYHVPSDADWTTLITFLGGETVAGGKMKSTTGWNSPNSNATNSSGFTGLPGGWRLGNDGAFINIFNYGYWWSSTENSSTDAWISTLGYDGGWISSFGSGKKNGFSVRCIKD